jgi:hypothetical protein
VKSKLFHLEEVNIPSYIALIFCLNIYFLFSEENKRNELLQQQLNDLKVNMERVCPFC